MILKTAVNATEITENTERDVCFHCFVVIFVSIVFQGFFSLISVEPSLIKGRGWGWRQGWGCRQAG